MTKSKRYLALQAVVCVALVLLNVKLPKFVKS